MLTTHKDFKREITHYDKMASGTSDGATASTTITESKKDTETAPTLKLRSANSEKKGIRWSEDTVDNEGQGKKSSKCCCVYRKPVPFGESSDESSDSDDEKCKGPKDYHKNAKKKHKHDDENCNSCH